MNTMAKSFIVGCAALCGSATVTMYLTLIITLFK